MTPSVRTPIALFACVGVLTALQHDTLAEARLRDQVAAKPILRPAKAAQPGLTAVPNPAQNRPPGIRPPAPQPALRARSGIRIPLPAGNNTELATLRTLKTPLNRLRGFDPVLQAVSRPFKGTAIPTPPGYGRYCSIVHGGGPWLFGALPGSNSDPCAELRKDTPGGIVMRAGLWSEAGENNVMVRCDGVLILFVASGAAPIDLAYAEAEGRTNCVFTIAPAVLPVFGLPYGKTNASQGNPSADVTVSRGFDYNVYNVAMSASDFGQTPAAYNPSAIWIDRKGRQRDYEYVDSKDGQTKRADGEGAYDWPMPHGKPIHAVADGEVIGARWRDVSAYGCGDDDQNEIYIYHQVGTGIYAERFVTYYAHQASHNVVQGYKVRRGEVIGFAGNTGCSGGDHLHFSVVRTTNLSGARSYFFEVTDDGYGVNGVHGVIDPFGWAAPANVDPWAWMMLGVVDTNNVVKEPGAFSMNLWDQKQPPGEWN